MDRNEVIQITIVALIILLAMIWAIIKIIRIGKKKGSGNCSGCAQASDCAAKELVERAKANKERTIKRKEPCYRDEQSAKN